MFTITSRLFLSALTTASLAGSAFGDNHLGIDTTSGQAGDHVVIRAGYYSNESQFTISGGRLLENGSIAVKEISTPLTDSGTYNGWYSENAITLASDFFFVTGRLNGGSFKFELSSVAPLDGGSAVLAWGDYSTDAFDNPVEPVTLSAFSSAATRLGRSFDVGVNEHDDNQTLAFSSTGLYDVTFVAWDSNGRYLDSAPVTVRFNVVPAPGGTLAASVIMLAMVRRRRA